MEKKIEIIFDRLIFRPFNHRLELINKLYNLSYTIEKKNDKENYQVNIKEINYKGIFSLGRGLCLSAYHWNKNIERKIVDRSSINNFTGEPYFNGSNEEKIELNKIDLENMLNFSENYFRDFIPLIKNLNSSLNISSIFQDKKHFIIDLDYPDLIEGSVAKYNSNYKTNFFVSKIELIEQLYFATIEVSKASLLDIFCLGYEICLDHEEINHPLTRASHW